MTVGNPGKAFQHTAVPGSDSTAFGEVEFDFVPDIETVTGGADQHAGTAGKTFLTEMLPHGVRMILAEVLRAVREDLRPMYSPSFHAGFDQDFFN